MRTSVVVALVLMLSMPGYLGVLVDTPYVLAETPVPKTWHSLTMNDGIYVGSLVDLTYNDSETGTFSEVGGPVSDYIPFGIPVNDSISTEKEFGTFGCGSSWWLHWQCVDETPLTDDETTTHLRADDMTPDSVEGHRISALPSNTSRLSLHMVYASASTFGFLRWEVEYKPDVGPSSPCYSDEYNLPFNGPGTWSWAVFLAAPLDSRVILTPEQWNASGRPGATSCSGLPFNAEVLSHLYVRLFHYDIPGNELVLITSISLAGTLAPVSLNATLSRNLHGASGDYEPVFISMECDGYSGLSPYYVGIENETTTLWIFVLNATTCDSSTVSYLNMSESDQYFGTIRLRLVDNASDPGSYGGGQVTFDVLVMYAVQGWIVSGENLAWLFYLTLTLGGIIIAAWSVYKWRESG